MEVGASLTVHEVTRYWFNQMLLKIFWKLFESCWVESLVCQGPTAHNILGHVVTVWSRDMQLVTNFPTRIQNKQSLGMRSTYNGSSNPVFILFGYFFSTLQWVPMMIWSLKLVRVAVSTTLFCYDPSRHCLCFIIFDCNCYIIYVIYMYIAFFFVF